MKKITRIRMSFAFLLLVLLLAMLIVVVPDAAVAAQDGDYTYTLGGRPIVATITKYTGTGGAIAIPSTLGGYATAAIGEYAFWNCGNVTSVTIPVSVTSIGDAAFMKCTSLTAIDVLRGNPSYESVGGVLYNKTDSLVQYPGGRSGPFIMPNTVTSIGDRAFAQCTLLTSVAIGEKVVSIGAWAFLECTGLTSVTIPDSVTTIGREAFRYCTWTTSMVVGRNVTSIGQDAFNYCTHLTSLSFLGMIAPIDVGVDWIRDTPWGLRGHAFTASNFPNPGEDFRGLLMGTVIPAVPGIPANISALPGNGQVALNWTAPSDDGGRTIDSYVICQDGVILPTVVFDTSANITGLTNGQTYSFSIAAHNSMGNGTCSPAIVITPATVPSMPQNVAASAGPRQRRSAAC